MQRIGFVILTWNSSACIERCLASIGELREINSFVCVVDNGSVDHTLEIVRRVKKGVSPQCHIHEIALRENQGTTVSRNRGIQNIPREYPYLCILDSDTAVNEEALLDMARLLEEDSSIGIIGPRLVGLDGSLQPSARKIPMPWVKLLKAVPLAACQKKAEMMETLPDSHGDDVVPAGYLMSACWLMRHTLVDEIGLLDEKIFYAPEDVEYCLRAWKNGYRVLYDKRVSILHEWQRLSRKKRFSRHNWEHIKGLFYMYRKYRLWFGSTAIEQFIH